MQLVFIHGAGGSSRDWQLQQKYFQDAVILDLPGHPEGDPLPSIDEYAAWVKGRIEEKNMGPVILVGHSMGGAVALTIALNCPEYLKGVVTVGSGARLQVADMFLNKLKKIVQSPELFPEFLALAYEKIDPETASSMMAQAKENGPAVMLNDLSACNRFDIMNRLESICIPVLALCGDSDVMTPPKFSKFLAEHIPDARVNIIPGGTHMVFAENPDSVNREIEAFCDIA